MHHTTHIYTHTIHTGTTHTTRLCTHHIHTYIDMHTTHIYRHTHIYTHIYTAHTHHTTYIYTHTTHTYTHIHRDIVHTPYHTHSIRTHHKKKNNTHTHHIIHTGRNLRRKKFCNEMFVFVSLENTFSNLLLCVICVFCTGLLTKVHSRLNRSAVEQSMFRELPLKNLIWPI